MIVRPYRTARAGSVRPAVLVLIALVALIGVGVLGWLSLPKYRQWKLHRFQNQAREFLQKTNLNAAWLAGQQALVLNATNLETLRLMADIAGIAHQPEAIAFRRKLAELEPGNVANRLAWAQTALAFERPPFAETLKALSGVPPAATNTVEYHFISAALALKQGDVGRAETHFQSVVDRTPTNTQARINLAVLRLRSPDETKRTAAQQTLEQLRRQPESRLSVLRSLASYCRQTEQFAKALEYSGELIAEKAAILDDKLLHAQILKASGNAGFREYLTRLQNEAISPLPSPRSGERDRVRGSDSEAPPSATDPLPDSDGDREKVTPQVAAVLSWMRDNGLIDEAFTWARSLPKDLQEQVPVEMTVADLYAVKKDWAGMQEYLRDQNWDEREFIRHALTAFALRNSGDKESADLRWNRAIRAAENQPHLLGTLFRMASSWGWNGEAEALLLTMIEQHPAETWASDTLLEAYVRAGNTAGVKKVFAMQVEADGKNLSAKNNLAVASFLLKENAADVAKAQELAREVYETDKKNPAFVGTYAYGLHLQGKSKEARGLFEQLDQKQLFDPSTAVYYGVVLAATGADREKTIAALEVGERASMLPEERALAKGELARIRNVK